MEPTNKLYDAQIKDIKDNLDETVRVEVCKVCRRNGKQLCQTHRFQPTDEPDQMSYKDHQRKQKTSKNFDSVYD